MVVPVREELRVTVKQLEARLMQGVQRAILQRSERLVGLARGLPRPEQLLALASQKLDDWAERLRASLPLFLQQKMQSLALLSQALKPTLLLKDIEHQNARMIDYQQRLSHSIMRLLDQRNDKIKNLISLLESFNVSRVLERGFVLVRDEKNAIVKTAQLAKNEHMLTLQFVDGNVSLIPKS